MTSDFSPTDRRCYQFGPYVVDASKRLLWRNRSLVPVTSKAFEILLLLIRRRGRVVDKQELMDAVWARTAVEENTLTRHISTLRKVLEERPEHHEYILTVPGYGYQFVAEVVELDKRPDDLQHTVTVPSNGNATAEHARDTVLVSGAPAGDAAAAARDLTPANATPQPHRPSSTASVATIAAGLVLTVVTTTLVVATLKLDPTASAPTQRALRQFTFHGGLQKDPTWSPDGRRVAYVSDYAGNSDIWVQTIGDPAPVQITSSLDEDSQPDWSPDGTSIAFRSEREGGGLFVVSALGGTPRKMTTFGYQPRWSPAGNVILFSSLGHLGGTPRFHVVGLDGGLPQPLRPDLLTDFSPLYVAWRSDGQSFSLWGRHTRDGWTFLTAPVRGGPPVKSSIAPDVDRRLRDAGLMLDSFVWSGSGRHLYFEGRAHETRSLWRVRIHPKTLAWIDGPDRLTTGTTQDTDAAISPDGARLVYSARSVRTRLWMFPFDAIDGKVTGTGQPVTSGGAGEQDADTPDDGSKLVYRTIRAGTQQVWEHNLADGHERLLVHGDQWNRTRPRWSSDGSRISYLRRRVNPNGVTTAGSVVVLTVDRGEERLLTRQDGPQVIPSDWSADGRWVLGGCPQPSTRRVATCLLAATEGAQAGASVRVVASDPTYNLFEQRFSPDQRWISFIAVNGTDAGVSTLFVMPASGGPWKAITDGMAYDDKPHWAPDGRTIYFVSPRNGVLNVWARRFEAASGSPAGGIFQVTSFNSPRQMISPQLSQMQIAVTPGRLFLPITETQSELWILQNVDR